MRCTRGDGYPGVGVCRRNLGLFAVECEDKGSVYSQLRLWVLEKGFPCAKVCESNFFQSFSVVAALLQILHPFTHYRLQHISKVAFNAPLCDSKILFLIPVEMHRGV